MLLPTEVDNPLPLFPFFQSFTDTTAAKAPMKLYHNQSQLFTIHFWDLLSQIVLTEPLSRNSGRNEP